MESGEELKEVNRDGVMAVPVFQNHPISAMNALTPGSISASSNE